jgi:hypothetical protein
VPMPKRTVQWVVAHGLVRAVAVVSKEMVEKFHVAWLDIVSTDYYSRTQSLVRYEGG